MLIPADKNQVLVRFENLADKIDNVGAVKAKDWNLDVHQFAVALYQDINPSLPAPNKIRIERMDLQGVHPIKEAHRFKWLAQGAPPSEQPPLLAQADAEAEEGPALTHTTIQPQQLETFRITYMEHATDPAPKL